MAKMAGDSLPFEPPSWNVRKGVGQCRARCDEAECGECSEDRANAVLVHVLTPFGLQVLPVYAGVIPIRGQYCLVRIPIRNPYGGVRGVRSRPWCKGIHASQPLSGKQGHDASCRSGTCSLSPCLLPFRNRSVDPVLRGAGDERRDRGAIGERSNREARSDQPIGRQRASVARHVPNVRPSRATIGALRTSTGRNRVAGRG